MVFVYRPCINFNLVLCILTSLQQKKDEGDDDQDPTADDMTSQERHNKALQRELTKRTPNDETVLELFKKGSEGRINWIHDLSC